MAEEKKGPDVKLPANLKSSILLAIRENMERLENLATVITAIDVGKDKETYTKGGGGDQYSKSDKETYSKGPPDDNYSKSTLTIGDDAVINPGDVLRVITEQVRKPGG
jgi:hypothetical protein